MSHHKPPISATAGQNAVVDGLKGDWEENEDMAKLNKGNVANV